MALGLRMDAGVRSPQIQSRGRRMRRIVARVTAAGGVMLGAALAVTAVPAWSAPGDVVSAGPGAFSMDPVLRLPMPGVRATHVVYRSTDVDGGPNAEGPRAEGDTTGRQDAR